MKYLPGANAASEPLRPGPATDVMQRSCEHDWEIAVPAPVWHGLRSGGACLPASRRYTRNLPATSVESIGGAEPDADPRANALPDRAGRLPIGIANLANRERARRIKLRCAARRR